MNLIPLPIRTDRTLKKVPYVTYTLCFLNIFVFLNQIGMSQSERDAAAHQWGFIVSQPSIVTLFTSGFLHGDILHLFSNLLILWLVGTVLEAGIGSAVFLLFYLASLVCATTLYGVISRLFMHDSLHIPLIGASGAISGVTGLAAFRYFRLRVLTIPIISFGFLPIPIPIMVWVPMWAYALYFAAKELVAGFNLLTNNTDNMVAHWAHIGGLVMGVLMALLLKAVNEGRRECALEDSTRAAAGEKPRERSLQEVRELLRLHPNDPELMEAMAGLLMVQGHWAKSRDIYLKAVHLFVAAGQRDRAAISYLNALRAFPNTLLPPREQMTMASTLEALGHFREAVQAFGLIIEHYPDREEAETSLLRAALIYQRYLNDMPAAERLLKYFIERYPESHWHNLAQDRLKDLVR